MPSGATPTNIYTMPLQFGGEDLGIPVTLEAVEAMRAELPVTRHEDFRFVDDQFADTVEAAYAEIGAPKLTLNDAWQIFGQLSVILARMYGTRTARTRQPNAHAAV